MKCCSCCCYCCVVVVHVNVHVVVIVVFVLLVPETYLSSLAKISSGTAEILLTLTEFVDVGGGWVVV